MSWEEFVTRFQSEFALAIEMQQLAREFQDLRQTTETVAEITAKFRERALLVPQYIADEEMMKTRYHDMLRDDIREFVSFSGCKNLNDMIERARERAIELELRMKRMSEQVQTVVGQAKRPKTSDLHTRGQQGQSRCGMYGKPHSAGMSINGFRLFQMWSDRSYE